jgi:hypothetical protein
LLAGKHSRPRATCRISSDRVFSLSHQKANCDFSDHMGLHRVLECCGVLSSEENEILGILSQTLKYACLDVCQAKLWIIACRQ